MTMKKYIQKIKDSVNKSWIMVVIESKRRKRKKHIKEISRVITDVTSQATDEFVKLSLLLQRHISII